MPRGTPPEKKGNVLRMRRNSLIKITFVLVALAVSAGGLGRDKTFTPIAISEPGNGKLYVYWPGQRWGEKSRKSPEIQLDGKSLGLLKYKSYIELELPAGTYELKLTGESDASRWDGPERAFPAKIEPGENYYVRLQVKYDQASNRMLEGRMKYAVTFLPRDEQNAKAEMGGLKPLAR